MTIKLNLCVPLLMIALLSVGHSSNAQDSGLFPHVPRTYHYSKVEQSLIDQLKNGLAQLKNVKVGAALGENLAPQLIKDLKDGYFISNDTINQIMLLWTSYHPDAKSRLSFLDDLSQVIYDRPEIELDILFNKFVNINPKTDKDAYDKVTKQLWQIAKYAGIRDDYYDITTAFYAAQNALNEGDKTKADALFSRVFYYPWYRMDDSISLQYYFNFYKIAGKQLIYIRTGDLKALQRLNFAPAAADELNPILQQAIAETKKMDAKKAK